MKILIFILMISLANSLFPAIPGSLLFKKLSIEQGLSENSVYAIFQDSKGFMWFGTEAGLNRFDGNNFVIYKPVEGHRDSLSNYFIYSICEDDEGYIWVGSDDGLNRFDPKQENFTRYLPAANDMHSVSGSKIYCLFKDRAGQIWIGTDKGLNLYDKAQRRFDRFQYDAQNSFSLSHNEVRGLAQAADGRLLVATFGGGLNIFDEKKREFTAFRNDTEIPGGISSNDLLTVVVDKAGRIWLGSKDGGLNEFDMRSSTFTVYRHVPSDPASLSHDGINALLSDQDGNLWIGLTEGGLNFFDPLQHTFKSFQHRLQDSRSLSSDRILSLFQDRSGMFWVGTYGNGINKFRLQESQFIHYYANPFDPGSLSHNDTRSFCVDHLGQLWVGTDTRGLNLYDRASGKFRHFLSQPNNTAALSNDRVFSIVEDKHNNLWIGTYNGLNRFIPQSGKFQQYVFDKRNPNSLSDNRIRCMSLSPDGLLWIGTDGGGLNSFNPETGQFVRYRHNPSKQDSIGYDRIFGVYADGDNQTVWVGTFGKGLNILNRTKGIFTRYEHDPDNLHSIGNNYLMPIIKSREGTIWIGSNGGGLTKFEPKTGEFHNFTEADGLPNNTVYGIVEDAEGDLWLSTNKGLCRITPGTGKVKNYDVNDGLQSNEFNGGAYYRSQAGLIYFGGANGFNEFDPKTIKDNPNIPAIIITDFLLNNKKVPIGRMEDGRILLSASISETKALDLSYKDNFISFDFAALSFVTPEKNQYAYMLEGFNKDWIYTNNRHFVTYTNLPAKSYILHIKGSNNDGIWNETGIALPIRIAPPFWNTWWFRSLSVLSFILLGYGWYSYRVRNLEKAKKELEQLVAQRTRELREMSLRDPLTGLRNRRFIGEVLGQEITAFIKKKQFLMKANQNRRKSADTQVFGILMIDIDHFKSINDQFGHDSGDKWLVEFSRVLRQCIRDDDEAIRYGGEEFLVILKNTDPTMLETLVQKIKGALDRIDILLEKGAQYTCSIGFATFPFCATKPDLFSFENTIMMADLGLYYAKNNGRNMWARISAAEEVLPTPEQLERMITSLEFGLKQGLVTIKASR
jgi:diguanylate cyclase (GGDEF)-like protein